MRDPLTRETHALLDLARDGDDPTNDDRARLRRRVMLAVAGGAATGATAVGAGTASAAATLPAGAAGAAATAAASATSVSVTGITGLGAIVTKAVLAVAAIGVVSVGVIVGPDVVDPVVPTAPSSLLGREMAMPETSPVESRAVAVSGRAAAGTAGSPSDIDQVAFVETAFVETAFVETEASPTPTAARGHRRREAMDPPVATIPSAPSAPSINEEVVLLRRATAARQAGDAHTALTLLASHARRFPEGILAPERDAARVLTLCDLGRLQEGREAAALFGANHPSSPLLGRVRSACQ